MQSHYVLNAVCELLKPGRTHSNKLCALVDKYDGTPLSHREAHARAKQISACRGVGRVVITMVTEQHEATYRRGARS